MKANRILTQTDWKRITANCNSYTSEFLLLAINEHKEQKREYVITAEAFSDLSHKLLVEEAIKCIRQTNKCDERGTLIWIDPEGKFVIPTNKELTIYRLPIGTKLMWDAPPMKHADGNMRVIYPAIVSEHHRTDKLIKITMRSTYQWMGPTSEYLRYPTDEETTTLKWPSI